jgi:uncharacterized protein (DUF2267 family)
VKYDEMVGTVAKGAGVSRREADDIILATLRALAERLTPDETKDLLAQLPKKYKENVNAVSNPRPMTADEFVGRVAELRGDRAGTSDAVQAEARAVLTTLRDAVNAGELHDIFDQLGDDFAPLFGLDGNGFSTTGDDVEEAFDALEKDVAESFDAMKETVDDAVDEVQARAASTAGVVGDVGREHAHNLAGTIGAVAGVVTHSVSTVVSTARDRALDIVVLAVDQLEAVTDKLDDAAEALQERVHRRVDAQR